MRQLILLLSFLFVVHSSLQAQDHAIVISKEKTVLAGKEYYMHVVEKGQTLYSICKAYHVEIGEVQRVNKMTDNAVTLSSVLLIPVGQDGDVVSLNSRNSNMPLKGNEAVNDEKNGFYKHVVKPGETLYAISKMYAISVRKILKYNKQINSYTPLSVGETLYLPKSLITLPKTITPNRPVVPTVEENVPEHKTNSPIQNPVVNGATKEEMHAVIPPDSDITGPIRSSINVAILLPLYASEQVDTTAYGTFWKQGDVLAKSEQFIHYYQGLLVAFDSLQRAGYTIRAKVFDTKKQSIYMAGHMSEINAFHPDIVFGPIYGSVYGEVIRSLENKNVPVIYPLSTRGAEFRGYKNYVQLSPRPELIEENLTRLVVDKSRTSHVIFIDSDRNDHGMYSSVHRGVAGYKASHIDSLKMYNYHLTRNMIDTLSAKSHLSKTTDNVFVVTSTNEAEVGRILSALSVLAERYPISVVGMIEWLDFTSLELSLFHRLNTYFITPHYIDYEREDNKRFISEYVAYCRSFPHRLAFRAYDMALYSLPLLAHNKHNVLSAFSTHKKVGQSSVFSFPGEGQSLENRGMWLLNYKPNYDLSVTPIE